VSLLTRARRRPGRATPPRRRRLPGGRRLVSAALLALATAVAVDAVAAGPDDGVDLAVAARDLPAGHALTAGDLTTVRVPAEVVPDGALAAGDAGGAALSAPVRRGEPVTDARVGGTGLLTAAPPGTMAVPVRVGDDAVLGLLRPGDEVAVLAGADVGGLSGDGGEVLVHAAPVLHLPEPGAGLLDAPGAGAVVVLGLDRAQATRVADATGRRSLLLGLLPAPALP